MHFEGVEDVDTSPMQLLSKKNIPERESTSLEISVLYSPGEKDFVVARIRSDVDDFFRFLDEGVVYEVL